MKKLTQEQKLDKTGGSFYAIALGIGILVSTASTLISNIVVAAKTNGSSSSNYSEIFGSQRRNVMMRLSPVPSRSSVTVF